MENIVNQYPYNSYSRQNEYGNKFINKKLGSVITSKDIDDGTQYGFPYIYSKIPTLKEYPIETKDGPTSIRRKYKKTYRIRYVHIDSRDRNILSQVIPGTNFIELNPNPFAFVEQSNIMTIIQPNHDFKVNEKVYISNAASSSFLLNSPFSIANGKSFMRITIPQGHGLTLAYATSQNLYIEILNVTSDVGIFSRNLINGKHKLFLIANYDMDSNTLNTNYIYIQLDKPATYDFNDTLDPITFGVLPPDQWRNKNTIVNFLFIRGVSLFYINTGIPRNDNHLFPTLSVMQVLNNNAFTVKLDVPALETGTGGESCVQMTKIVGMTDSFSNANNYVYEFKNTFQNVVRVKMISSEFPNFGGGIIQGINDSLDWLDLDDTTDTLYTITIPPGNYTILQLETQIQSSLNSIPRANTNPPEYHMFLVKLDPATNIVTFSQFRQHIFANAMFIKYTIEQAGTTQVLSSAFLYIIDANNNLSIGDKIFIVAAPDYDIVPSSVIVGGHTIIDINNYTEIDNVLNHEVNGVLNPAPFGATSYTVSQCLQLMGYTTLPKYYKVQLQLFDPLPVVGNTPAGFSPFQTPLPDSDTIFICNTPTNVIIVNTPTEFSMFFNKSNTLGSVLGFRNPGAATSITNYQQVISNTDPYAFEQIIPPDPMTKITNNALNLIGDGYFFMCSPTLQNLECNVPNVFTKILLNDKQEHGDILYNTFVTATKDFADPLPELPRLELSFVNRDGSLHNFYGRDHSFTLEIIELLTRPYDINVSSRSGQSDPDLYTTINPVLFDSLTK